MSYTSFKERFHIELNKQQDEAVQAVDGSVLLLAVPGSGKTTVLVDRLGYMIFECGIDPKNILTITYTDAATRDMKQRFLTKFGEEYNNQIEFRTINGISQKILMYLGQKIGQKPFEIIDRKVQISLVKNIFNHVTKKFATEADVKNIESGITYVKNMRLSEEEISKLDIDVKKFPEIYKLYQEELRKMKMIDYDDQMVYALMVLQTYPKILNHFRDLYKYICVDEAQDTSKIQHDLIELLAGEDGNLFMVGDEDQSIFGFRAAYPEALVTFEKRRKNAKVLLMESNYRSNEEIVAAANRLIQENTKRHEKKFVATRPSGGVLRQLDVKTRKAQYSYLIKVARHCDRETAILYRNNESALPLIDAFEREEIPYRMKSREMTFFSHPIVTDICDFIRLALDPFDEEAFMNIYYKMGAGISKINATKVVEMNRRKKPLIELLDDLDIPPYTKKQCRTLATHFINLKDESAGKAVYRILNYMGYASYMDEHGMDTAKSEILQLLANQEENVSNFLPHLEALQETIAKGSTGTDCNLVLSTIHSSKGLEYDRVYMMDMLDGVLPSVPKPTSSSSESEVSLYEEERRLYYVAMTRAKNELYIFTQGKAETSAFSKKIFDGKVQLEQKLKEVESIMGCFKAGAIVNHKKYGRGVIVDRKDNMAEINFDGESVVKKLSLEIAIGKGLLTTV
ncbi:MAG: ATP-dependent helicase [Lachnospiraceae bacterium]|nr:ATP-dependent helicase [Lachnospiraceae bacterium]